MAKITYEDKEFLNKNENIANKNKVNDTDLNQIKEAVNGNDDKIGDLSNLNTINKDSLVGAINELLPIVLYETDKTYSNVETDTVITLNDDITNYKRIKVYGISNKNNLTYIELFNPSVNNVFSLNYFSNGSRSGEYAFSTIFRNFIVQSNTQIRYDTGAQLASRITSNNNLHGYVEDVQTIKIYQILGYKN